MGRTIWRCWGAAMLLLCGGCMTGPLLDNPVRVQPVAEATCNNPAYIPLGPSAYGMVFEHVLDVVDDYFEISYANRYDGRIETFPMTAPGLEQPWKPGSPDFPQRLLATFQSIRHRAVVTIKAAEDGGYFVDVKVFKELEDLSRPTQALAGAAIFRSAPTVERQYEVIDAAVTTSNWIPIGRDVKLEQVLLKCLEKVDPKVLGQ